MMLLAHVLSGDQSGLFIDRTRAGLNTTMAAFHGQGPGANKWVCQVGLTSEAARVLLPLAWLVRLDDTAEHRTWVNQVAAVLLERQQPSGAIKEWPFGPNTTIDGSVVHDQCLHHPPFSNADYGTGESTMSQTGEDPASDLLYSNNFALQSLYEAAQATQEPKLLRAAESLRVFIIRAQVTVRAGRQYQTDAKESLRLEGAWLRSFDFQRWEHYAQASDWQWGPWVAETGHGMSLITMTLAAMDRNTSMWTILTAGGARMSKLFDTLLPQYLQVKTDDNGIARAPLPALPADEEVSIKAKGDWPIVVAQNASAVELFAVDELTLHLDMMCPDRPAVLSTTSITVGFDAAVASGHLSLLPSLDGLGDEGLVVVSSSETGIVLTGGSDSARGTLYAVYEWLDLLGLRFIAEDETLIPACPANRGGGWPVANLTKGSEFEYLRFLVRASCCSEADLCGQPVVVLASG
jgi:hypothetical protein